MDAVINATAAPAVTSTLPPPNPFTDPAAQLFIKELTTNLDQFFVVINGVIIFYIQAGFAFLEAGSVRAKNTTNIFMKNLLDALFGGLAYWLFGHALAFGSGSKLAGFTQWPIAGLEDTEYAHWFYQFVYASTSASIVSGAVAERCSMVMYLSYTTLITGIIYPTCVHWAWSPHGWLINTPFHDFSGSGVVHMVGGASCIVATLLLGPRTDLFDPMTGRKRVIRGHSTPLVALGCFTLFFGIMAFNGSSVGHITQPGDGAKVALSLTNTVLSGAAGGVSAMFYRRLGWFINEDIERRCYSFLVAVNGMFVGMVSVCAGCDTFPTWASVICGSVAAAIFLNIRRLTQRSRYIDDPLDAIAVHFGGGWWGLVCAALFTKNGFFLAGNREMLFWNIAGGLSMTCWAWLLVGTLFGTYRYFGIHRLSPEEELRGMDIVKHLEPAYPPEDWTDEPTEDYDGSKKNSMCAMPPTESAAGLVKRDALSRTETGASGDEFEFMMRDMSRNNRYQSYPRVVIDAPREETGVASGIKNVSATGSRTASFSIAEPRAETQFGTSEPVPRPNPFNSRYFSLRAVAKKLQQGTRRSSVQSDDRPNPPNPFR